MELKQVTQCVTLYGVFCLNRTFYGIETLNVPKYTFYPLCLNRTFYGIETIQHRRNTYNFLLS